MGGVLSHQEVSERYVALLEKETVDFLNCAVAAIVEAKGGGRKVVVVTGSRPDSP